MREHRLAPNVPYSLSRTVGAFARFPEESVDIATPGGYRRCFNVDGEPVLVEATQDALPEDGGTVTLRTLSPDSPGDERGRSALDQMRTVIALGEPIDDVYPLITNDERLSGLLPALNGLRRTLDPTPFEGLVSSILAQLISIRGAATVRSRLVQRFGRSLRFAERDYWTFPEPEAVADSTVDELCGLKMTSAKARAILAVTSAALDGELCLDQLQRHPDDELVRHLTAMPGIGPWTAEWFLINVMGRMSIVPTGDLGIRRSTGNWFLGGEMPSPGAVRSLYEPFGERRAYVAYYVLSAERHAIPPRLT